MCDKLGLQATTEAAVVMDSALSLLQASRVDFTTFFYTLANSVEGTGQELLALFSSETSPVSGNNDSDAEQWLADWRQSLEGEEQSLEGISASLRKTNPINIPRLEAVEKALDDANLGNMETFEALLAAVQSPYEEREEWQELVAAGSMTARRTFCET